AYLRRGEERLGVWGSLEQQLALARLAGLQIKPGFLKEAARRVGGTLGCTHLRELLQQMATTAYQTIDPARAKREADAAGEADVPGSDRLDTRIAAKMGGAPAILLPSIYLAGQAVLALIIRDGIQRFHAGRRGVVTTVSRADRASEFHGQRRGAERAAAL
ncbi:DUF2889 domain-containing protein, partial [Lacticaseibacillus rhamnosus]